MEVRGRRKTVGSGGMVDARAVAGELGVVWKCYGRPQFFPPTSMKARIGLNFIGYVILSATLTFSQNTSGTNDHAQEQAAFRAAMKEDPLVRDAALTNLVRSAREDVATEALVALIRLRTKDVEALALSIIPKVSDRDLHAVLGASAETIDRHLGVTLARAALNRIATRASISTEPEGVLGPAGLAAMLLTDETDAVSGELVGTVVKLRPKDPGLWLYFAKWGVTNNEVRELARNLLQSDQVPTRVRLSAAAALASSDAGAGDYVIRTLTSFLQEVAPQRAEDVLVRVWNEPRANSKGTQRTMPPTCGLGVGCLSALEFLQGPDAERLTFEFLDSENQWVRESLGAIAAIRWPERYLGTNLEHSDERKNLLAAIGILHPALLTRVEAMVSKAELQSIESKMLATGIEAYCRLQPGAGIIF